MPSLYQRWKDSQSAWLPTTVNQNLPVFSGQSGAGSGWVSSSGIGGRTTADINASDLYQQELEAIAQAKQQNLVSGLTAYKDTMEQVGVQPDTGYMNRTAQDFYTTKQPVFGGL